MRNAKNKWNLGMKLLAAVVQVLIELSIFWKQTQRASCRIVF